MSEKKSKSFSFTKLFVVLLTIVFAASKVTGHIDWSWFKVFLPVIIYIGIKTVFVIFAIISAIIYAVNKRKEQERKYDEFRKKIEEIKNGQKWNS